MDYQQQPPPSSDPSPSPSSDPSPSPSDRPLGITSPETPSNKQNHEIEDIMACVTALEAGLLPCLPARELQAIDRSPHPSHQIDVERHARDFMEAAKKLQLYFMGLKREDRAPTRAESLKKEIAVMEEELKTKEELIKKHTGLFQESEKLVKEQIEKHRVELEKV